MVGVVAVDTGHVIDIIILHGVDELLNEWLVKLEAGEVLGRILIRNGLLIGVSIHEVSSVFSKLANFGVMLGS